MRILILFCLAIMPVSVFAQTIKYNLPPDKFYSHANIGLHDFSKYESRDLNILSDGINFIDTKTNLRKNITLDKIDYIKVYYGNQGLKWAGYGAIFMGAMAFSILLNSNSYQKDPGMFFLGFTVTGALVGTLYGLSVSKEKTYYLNY